MNEFLLDQLSKPYLPLLLAVCVTLPVLLLFVTNPATRQARCELVALDFGLQASGLSTGTFERFLYLPVIRGELEGFAFELREVQRRAGRSVETWTTVRLACAPPLSEQLHAVREGYLLRMKKGLGAKEATLGDEELDRRLFFKVLPEFDRELLRRPAIRNALLTLLQHPVTLERGALNLEVQQSFSELELRQVLTWFRAFAVALTDGSLDAES